MINIIGLFTFLYPIAFSIIYLLLSLRYKKQEPPDNKPDLTILIATTNKNFKFECEEYPVYIYYDEVKQTKAHALNNARGKINTEWILIIDDDMHIENLEYLNLLTELDHSYWGGGGRIVPRNNKKWIERYQNLEYTSIINLTKKAQDKRLFTVSGACMFMRTSLFNEHGFDDEAMTEDIEFTSYIQNLGYKTFYIQELLALTDVPSTLKKYLKQRQRWIYGGLQAYDQFSIRYKLEYALSLIWLVSLIITYIYALFKRDIDALILANVILMLFAFVFHLSVYKSQELKYRNKISGIVYFSVTYPFIVIYNHIQVVYKLIRYKKIDW